MPAAVIGEPTHLFQMYDIANIVMFFNIANVIITFYVYK